MESYLYSENLMPNYVCSRLVSQRKNYYRYMNRMHINGLFMFGFYIKTTRKPAFWNRVITIQNQLSSFSLCLTEVLAFPRCRQASNFVFLLQFLSHRDKECVDLLRECCICRMHHFPTTKIGNKSWSKQPIGCVVNSLWGQTVSWLHRKLNPSRTERNLKEPLFA